MAPPRAFDYELLKQLLLEHPEWSNYQYADALTADNRRKDPSAREVPVGTVHSVISRMRSAWEEEEGRVIPSRFTVYTEMLPSGSIHPDHIMDTELRNLRALARTGRETPIANDNDARERRLAVSWEARMRRDKTILCLDVNGVPFVREAAESELDEDGNLLALATWLLPSRV